MAKKQQGPVKTSRREFVKKAAYVAPAIVTLKAAPSFATPGSIKPQSPNWGPEKNPLIKEP